MLKNISGFQIEINRKKIKNLYLSVLKDGKIRLSVPNRVPDSVIEQFVISKSEWIVEKQKQISERIDKPVHKFADGENLFVFGEEHRLCVKGGSRDGVICENGKIILTLKNNADLKKREEIINKYYREILKIKIDEYLPKWEEITQLYSDSWQIKNMKTRWGTCNISTKKIWLNLQLAKFPIECLEYVILHELAHLAVSNHGPEFCTILDKFMPDWRGVRKRLNEEQCR